MRYNVATLLHEPVGSTRDHPIDEPVTFDGGSEPVHGHLTFIRTRSGVLVRGDLALTVDDRCARCLREVRTPVSVHFEEECIPTIDIDTGAPVPVPEGVEEPYRIDEHHELDVDAAARDYLQMERPMAVLCREDCPGLCPDCGAELAEGREHRCQPEAVDERWRKLLDFHVR